MADLLIIILVVITLINIKYIKKGFNDDYLSKDSCLVLKGLFCLVVVLYHLSNLYLKEPSLSYELSTIGFIANSVFFFITGYGLMYNTIKKANYSEGYINKRLLPLLFLYLFTIILYWARYEFVGEHYSISKIINMYLIGKPFAVYSWYIVATIIVYIIYYFIIRILKNRYKLIILITTVFCLLWILIRIKINFGEYMSDHILSIPLGMLWALYKNHIDKYIKKLYWPLLLLVGICFVIHWRMVFINTELEPFAHTLNTYRMSLLFPILVLLITMKFKIGNNILKYIGEISLEIYLYHGIFVISIMDEYISPYDVKTFLTSGAVVVLAIAFSSIVHKLYVNIKKSIL